MTSSASKTLEFSSRGQPNTIEILAGVVVVADTTTMEVDVSSNSRGHSPLPTQYNCQVDSFKHYF